MWAYIFNIKYLFYVKTLQSYSSGRLIFYSKIAKNKHDAAIQTKAVIIILAVMPKKIAKKPKMAGPNKKPVLVAAEIHITTNDIGMPTDWLACLIVRGYKLAQLNPMINVPMIIHSILKVRIIPRKQRDPIIVL